MFAPVLAALQAAFVWLLPKVAVFFGIFALSNAVIRPIFDFLKAQVLAQLGSASAQFSQFFQILGIYDALNIVFSAYLLALSIKSVKSSAT